mmetsp:Transcript_110140/g.164839  ORF Transcript_110140/g.164839 Transcript_110140/m.164839 type:complete len:84 (-) Transcript_110140:478-729(-)
MDDNVDTLIDSVAKVNKNTVVVASAPGSVLMPWSDKVSAILFNLMPGQEVGHAVSDILFGEYNPSARLPITIMNHDNEIGMTE